MSRLTEALHMELKAVSFDGTRNREQEFQFMISNDSEEEVMAVICLQTPLDAEPFEYLEIETGNLTPGSQIVIPMSWHFSMGGRYLFYYWIKGAQIQTLQHTSFLVSGPGYYSGDTHTHSVYSDGKGTLTENRTAMIEKGHSFLYSTDHNTMKHNEEILRFQGSEEAAGFLHMAGWEFTSAYGHALAYGTEQPEPVSRMTERGNTGAWQSFVDDMNDKNGIVYLAHPYEAPRYEFGDMVLEEIRDMAGIEVWNGFHHHALAHQNRKAFELWDQLNSRGNGRYAGNAVSDAHRSDRQGNPYIKGYFDALDEEGVCRLLKTGRFFGSNGPELRFSIGGWEMGEICTAKEGVMLPVHLTAFDPMGMIREIVLIRGICGSHKRTEKVKSFYPSGSQDKRIVDARWYMKAQPGTFYRVEMITEFGAAAIDCAGLEQETGFAYTNPVWVL